MSTAEKKHNDPERAQSRRNQVLNAAETCFKRSGFHGASMAEISKAAGMSAGHIYNYFDNKDAIIAAFVEKNVERVSALMENLGKQADPLQSMIDDADRSVREHFDPDGWALPLEIAAEAARNPSIAEVVHDADRRSRDEFRVLLRSARAQHQLANDDRTLDELMDILITLYQGLRPRIVHNPDLDKDALVANVRATLKLLLFS